MSAARPTCVPFLLVNVGLLNQIEAESDVGRQWHGDADDLIS